jgi:chromosome segregation ATPase
VVSHKAYAGIQTRLNQRNQAYEDLNTSFAALQEDHQRVVQVAEQRLAEIGTLRSQTAEFSTQMSEANAELLRVNAFRDLVTKNELGLAPEASIRLFSMLSQVPVGKDVEETKRNIKQLADFGKSVAQDHEKQLTAGVTPGYTGSTPTAPGPQTPEEWEKAVAGKPLNDPIWEAYRAFTFKKD